MNNRLNEELTLLVAEITNQTEEAHQYTKLHEVDSEWWNFYVGKMDGLSTARYKLQRLIEDYT